MAFDSWTYLLFLPVVWAIYCALRPKAQNLWLLLASYVFYGWWAWRFLGLIVGSTLLDYVAALRIARADKPHPRRRWLLTSVLGNLLVLGMFKYWDFFAESFAIALRTLGFEAHPATLHLILPVGISFYTFQSLSYTIDVYKGRLVPCRRLSDFALYVAFFPQLVAGPIERATSLLPQILSPRTITNRNLREGAYLILQGLFKKVALADAMSPLVDAAWSEAAGTPAPILWRGLYLFTFQIYCDFSGYSDIARGSAKLFGFELMENFRQPFLAQSFTDLWRRWHVSLSTWLRDYLYIPLGGSRGSIVRATGNLMITMVLSGLWHGANWTYVAWGFGHGVLLSLERIFRRPGPQPARPLGSPAGIFRAVLVFHALALLFLIFRAPSVGDALVYLGGLTQGLPLGGAIYDVAFYGSILLALDVVHERGGHHAAILSWPLIPRAVVITLMLLFVFSWSWGLGKPFIYFQF